MARLQIGVIAPSSMIAPVEFQLGIETLKKEGFQVQVHPQTKKKDLFFAGADEERARAFLEYAFSPEVDVLWCARGGFGALRLLPYLEKASGQIPRQKLLIGYSDATALMEYVRTRWGWNTLHAPMPSLRKFSFLKKSEWKPLLQCLHREQPVFSWKKMKFFGKKLDHSIEAPIVGGNLTVWTSLTGTPFQGQAQGSFLFFEDIAESLPRIERYLTQLRLSGGLGGIRGILLGDFLKCEDQVPEVLAKRPSENRLRKILENPGKKDLKPLRKSYSQLKGFERIWGELSEIYQIPVAYGLPVGHGPGFSPLPLGGRYELTPNGELLLKNWDWLSS